MICQILELFVNPLIASDKYSLLEIGKLFQHFRMQLSQKRKTFSELVFAFSKFGFNFEHFQKKMTLIGDFFELEDSEKRG